MSNTQNCYFYVLLSQYASLTKTTAQVVKMVLKRLFKIKSMSQLTSEAMAVVLNWLKEQIEIKKFQPIKITITYVRN